MKLLSLFTLFAALLSGQTQIHLRDGGPETRKNITGVQPGSPCTITAPNHNFQQDQVVSITYVTGVRLANGIRKVKNPTQSSFQLADLADAPIACLGVWRAPSGYVGPVTSVALKDFPRGPLDGPTGALTASLPSKAVPGWPVYEALLQRATLYTAQPYSGNYASTAVSGGWAVADLFQLSMANGSTAARDAAIHYLNNVEKIGAWKDFYCNESLADCGSGSGSHLDWAAYRLGQFAKGYAVGGNQLSAEERSVFRDKILNGYYGNPCVPVAQGVGWSQAAKNCGALWWMAHHTYAPMALTPGKTTTLAAAITSPAQTTIKLNRADDIPFVPAFALRGLEWLRFIGLGPGVDELAVERGVFGTTPMTHVANASMRWTASQFGKAGTASNATSWAAGNQIEYDESNTHNLVFAKHWAGIAVGIALASEDPRARDLLERSWNDWYDSSYHFSKMTWTGLNQGGTAYGNDRWHDWSTEIAIWAKHSFEPPIDITAGNWLKNAAKWYPHFSLPGNPKTQMIFGDSGVDTSIPLRRWKAAMKVAYLYPSDPFSTQVNHFLNTQANYMTQAGLHAEVEAIGAALLFTSPNPPQTPISDKHFFFQGADSPDVRFPGLGYNGVASRSSWESNATLIGAYALSINLDHTGSYACPGHYAIVTGNQWLVGSDSTSNLFGSGSTTLANCNATRVNGGVNQLPVTGNVSMATAAGTYGQYAFVDHKSASPAYAYWRINGTNAARATVGVTRHTRDFVHLKSSSPHSYLVVYDKINLSAAKPIEWTIHHPTAASSGSTVIASNLTGNLFTFTRGVLARSNELTLLPAAPPIVSSNAGGITTTSTAGTATSGEWLVIHRTSPDAADVMPPISRLTVPAGFVATEIEDESICRAVVVATDDAPHDGIALNTSRCTGQTELTVSGLDAATYAATVNGQPATAGIEVVAGGALFIPAIQGGSIVIAKAQGAPTPPPDPTPPPEPTPLPTTASLLLTEDRPLASQKATLDWGVDENNLANSVTGTCDKFQCKATITVPKTVPIFTQWIFRIRGKDVAFPVKQYRVD